MSDIAERLRELIVSDAFEKRVITSGQLAERLIGERRDAADAIERLQAALLKYCAHEPECGEPCDCGLDAVLATVHQQRLPEK